MDEFHILPEQFDKMRRSLERLAETIIQAKRIVMAYCNTFFDTLEPYQRYELAHPKKKPRGSIRRNKRNERKKKSTSLTESTLYIDDIYDIISGKNDQ